MSIKTLDNLVLLESMWVKDTSTRMRVFNGQIFDVIHERYSAGNKERHNEFLAYNFNRLNTLAYFDDEITNEEFQLWINKYDSNMVLLAEKERTDKKAFPEDDENDN